MAMSGMKKTAQGFWLAVCVCAALLGAAGQAGAVNIPDTSGGTGLGANAGNPIPVSNSTLTFEGNSFATGLIGLNPTTMIFNAAPSGSTVIDFSGGGSFNKASGALTWTLNGNFTFENSTGNYTATGATGNGGVIATSGALTIGGGGDFTANNNAVTRTAALSTNGVGGAISSGALVINTALTDGNTTFTNNMASGNSSTSTGGAVSADGGLQIGNLNHNLTVTNNYAGFVGGYTAPAMYAFNLGTIAAGGTTGGANGGAFRVGGDVLLEGSNLTLSNNHATRNGGLIYTVVDSSNPSNQGNVTVVGNLTAANNTASYFSGGLIEAHVGNVYINSLADSRVASVADLTTTITNNYAGGRNANADVTNGGGAINAAQGNVIVGDPTSGKVNISSNYAGFNIQQNATDATVFEVTDAINNATAGGGAINANGTVAILSKTDILVSDNHATNSGGAILAAPPGAATTSVAISDTAGTITMSNNTAGINFKTGAALTGAGVAAANGGAIDDEKGDVSITGTLVAENNVANGTGGVIYAKTGAITLNGASATLNNNQALAGDGGAIAAVSATGGVVSIGGSLSADGNNATGAGGAIFAALNDVNVGGSITLNNNTAQTGNGGGIDAASGTVTMTGALSASNNNASAAAGGAIFAKTGNVLVNGAATLNNNTAGNGNGGGIDAENGNVAVTGALKADSNKATGTGGAINATGDVTATAGLALTNNVATSGGGIDAGGSVTASGPMTIQNNVVGGSGGAILAGADITLTPSGNSVISNNHAGDGYGGALAATGSVTVTSSGNVLFENNQAGALGGAIYAGESLTLTANAGDSITFQANTDHTGPNAVYLENADGLATATLNANGGNITFFDPMMNNPANGVIPVTVSGSGIVSFDGAQLGSNNWSQMYANTEVQAGATMEVRNNAIYGTNMTLAGAANPAIFTVDAGATLQGGVAGTVIADQATIGGTLNIAGRMGGTTNVFTIDSATTTFNPGSRILFNTVLNQGDTATNSDLLVLKNGAATGTSSVMVTNVGGAGALTVGNGILLVQAVNANTVGLNLTLGNTVSAGAYDYYLGRGLDAGTINNWYLRDTVPVGPVVPPVVPPVNPGEPGAPEAPIVIPGPTLPNYRMEVPVYMAAPALANRMGLMMLGTYHERVGEDRPDDWDADDLQAVVSNGTDEPRKHSGWGRAFGQTGTVGFDKSGHNFASNGPSYDFDMGALQAGADIIRKQHDNGSRDIAGLYLGMMTGHADAKKVYSGGKAGTVDMNGYSLAAYWTHKGAKDWYLDAVLQGTRYADAQARSERGQSIQPDGWGLAASLEAGYPIRLGHKGWALEPQGQLIYQWISLNSDSDSYGRVKFDDSHAWYGRLGARLTKDWITEKGKKASVWARANLWHSFDSQAKTTFNSFDGQNPVALKTKLGGTWGQVGLGVNGYLTPRLTAFANGDYNFNLGDQTGHSLGGRVGLRYEF